MEKETKISRKKGYALKMDIDVHAMATALKSKLSEEKNKNITLNDTIAEAIKALYYEKIKNEVLL